MKTKPNAATTTASIAVDTGLLAKSWTALDSPISLALVLSGNRRGAYDVGASDQQTSLAAGAYLLRVRRGAFGFGSGNAPEVAKNKSFKASESSSSSSATG